jgi:hypothetical protein
VLLICVLFVFRLCARSSLKSNSVMRLATATVLFKLCLCFGCALVAAQILLSHMQACIAFWGMGHVGSLLLLRVPRLMCSTAAYHPCVLCCGDVVPSVAARNLQ